jgi:hypothetical protein
MWKIFAAFIAFALVALFVIMKGGDKVDMQGESSGHAPASEASAPAASAPAAPVAEASAPASAAAEVSAPAASAAAPAAPK